MNALMIAAALAGAVQVRPEPPERGGRGHLSWCPGVKFLDGDWEPADVQFGLGLVDFDYTPEGWPVGVAAQLLMSMSRETPDGISGSGVVGFDGIGSTGTYAWNVGLRRTWPLSPDVELFAGGGVSLIGAVLQLPAAAPGGSGAKDHDDDIAPGWWAGAGTRWKVDVATDLGFQLEYSAGKVTLFDETVDAGGLALLFSIGYRW